MQTSAKACPTAREIPGRSDAEVALAAALDESGRHSFSSAVLLVPDHLFGLTETGDLETADRALVASCQDFIRVLPAGSRVFRWSATSLVALTHGDGVPAVNRYAKLGRSEVFPLAGVESLRQFAQELDMCVAQSVS